MSVLYTWRDTLYVLWEREFNDGNIDVAETSTDGWGVSGGGEYRDGGGSPPEEAGEVEEWDDMALRHEREDSKVWTW